MRLIGEELKRIQKTTVAPSQELNAFLVSRETSPISTGTKLADLIRRPQIGYLDLAPFDLERPALPQPIWEQVEISLKYEGYIKKQLAQVQQLRRLEGKELPESLDYTQVRGLRLEAIEKLQKTRPANIGQASRISGVSPADISVLLIWMEQHSREEKE